jgi:heme-degrading monooxygenase HmoA
MYAVIFRAEINSLDAEYSAMAEHMRELAMKEYGCTEFIACTEGDSEIAISYWPSQEHIKAWHANPEHRVAQKLGKEKWYKSYQVDVTKVIR